jgi:hypothetical protein
MGAGDKTPHNGVLIVTDSRIVFYRKGFTGEVMKTVPMDSSTSYERNSNLGRRVIRLHSRNVDWEFKIFDKEGEAALVAAIEIGINGAKLESTTSKITQDSLTEIKRDDLTALNFYEQALNEVEKGPLHRALWGKSIADSDGDSNLAKSLYLKYRVEILSNEAKVQATESSLKSEGAALKNEPRSLDSLIQLLDSNGLNVSSSYGIMDNTAGNDDKDGTVSLSGAVRHRNSDHIDKSQSAVTNNDPYTEVGAKPFPSKGLAIIFISILVVFWISFSPNNTKEYSNIKNWFRTASVCGLLTSSGIDAGEYTKNEKGKYGCSSPITNLVSGNNINYFVKGDENGVSELKIILEMLNLTNEAEDHQRFKNAAEVLVTQIVDEGKLGILTYLEIGSLKHQVWDLLGANGEIIGSILYEKYFPPSDDQGTGYELRLTITSLKGSEDVSRSNQKNYIKEDSTSDSNIDKLTSYAVILGRASGCGIDVENESRRVGTWIDSNFSSQPEYLYIFVQGMEYHFKQQQSGGSPDTCNDVKRVLNGFPWPS